jgi:hypothetical protein
LERVKQRDSGLTDENALTKWRAAHAEALTLAQRLRATVVVFRRYAGELKYHPQVGVEGHIGQDLLDAAARLRELLTTLNALTARWDEETSWLRTRDAQMPIEEIQQGHAAAREAARLTRAALQIFDQAVLHPETAALDAPYGHSAPRRVHPGAQCTWVAERAEGLAIELSSVTLRKETLLLALQTS